MTIGIELFFLTAVNRIEKERENDTDGDSDPDEKQKMEVFSEPCYL